MILLSIQQPKVINPKHKSISLVSPVIDLVKPMPGRKLLLDGKIAIQKHDGPQPSIFIPFPHIIAVPMLIAILKRVVEYPDIIAVYFFVLHAMSMAIIENDIDCLAVVDSVV